MHGKHFPVTGLLHDKQDEQAGFKVDDTVQDQALSGVKIPFGRKRKR